MIIDPDMPDHWKTRMLSDLLDEDSLAPVYLLRLWGHCQNRRKCEFTALPPAAIKAICRYGGDAEAFDNALQECGFIERNGKEIEVLGWAEHNASMIANWKNGARGGRPKKKPEDNPEKTHGKPMENPDETHSKPLRKERKGKERKEQEPDGSSGEQNSPAAYSIPLTRGKIHPVTAEDLAHYRETYPAVDVDQSFRNMLEWLKANPKRRSGTAKGAKQRITNWLSRDQDKAAKSGPKKRSDEAETWLRGAV